MPLKVSKSQKQIMASWILPKKRSLGQFSVQEIAPAFVFWKNPGQHIFFRDFLTFSLLPTRSCGGHCPNHTFHTMHTLNSWYEQWIYHKVIHNFDLFSGRNVVSVLFFYCKRKKEVFWVWILYGHQVLDPNTRLLHLDELADFKLNFLFFASSACPFSKYILKVSKS